MWYSGIAVASLSSRIRSMWVSAGGSKAVALIAPLLWLAATSPSAQTQQPSRVVIEITAERFAFFPSEVTVERGATVEFHLRSDDTIHGFRIAGSDVNVAIPKRGQGERTAVWTATEAGRFTFECSR